MLKGDEDTRNLPEMRKRTKPAIRTSEPPLDLKRTRSLNSVSKQTTCSPPKRTSGKEQRKGGKSAQLEKRSAKKGISKSKGKLGASPEVQRSSAKATGSSHKYLGNGGAQEVHHASSSAEKARKLYPLTKRYAELTISSNQDESAMNDEDMSPPGTTLVVDSQGEMTDDPDGGGIPEVVQDDPEGVEPLLPELMDDILGRLPMLEVLQLRPSLGSALRNAIHRPAFRRNRPSSEGEFSPTYFMTDAKGDLHWHGFDTKLRKWTRLPSLNFAPKILPSPDPDLFKDYLMAGDGGLLCINVGNATGREKLVICNPLTQTAKVLPPLIHARHPVLMHLKVNHDSGHYQVIVAGSAVSGTEELSLKTEVYDSRSGLWECPDGSDLPRPSFGLNEYQNGAYIKDDKRELLMCVAIVDPRGRGVLVFDIREKRWTHGPHVKPLHIPLVRSEASNVSHLATTQILECGGCVFVFSEQECGKDVYFVIHKLILEVSGDFTWDEVMKRKRTGGRGLLVYPEFTCVPVSENELGIFNTVEHTLEIISLSNPGEAALLQNDSSSEENRFHSLNPIGFVFKPSFKFLVSPGGEAHCKAQSNKVTVAEQVPQNQIVESGTDVSKEPHPVSKEEYDVDPVDKDVINATGDSNSGCAGHLQSQSQAGVNISNCATEFGPRNHLSRSRKARGRPITA